VTQRCTPAAAAIAAHAAAVRASIMRPLSTSGASVASSSLPSRVISPLRGQPFTALQSNTRQ